VAGVRVVDMRAGAGGRGAAVRRAAVVVVAVLGPARLAAPAAADVADRAAVAVVAGIRVVGVHAGARRRRAAVRRAAVAVVAALGPARLAAPAAADVADRAAVAVVAGTRVVGVDARAGGRGAA